MIPTTVLPEVSGSFRLISDFTQPPLLWMQMAGGSMFDSDHVERALLRCPLLSHRRVRTVPPQPPQRPKLR